MRLCPPSARTAWLVCGLLGLLMAGCMPLGYAYPKMSYIPPGSVGDARDEVYAFRVDVTDDDNCLEITENDRYVLTRLPLRRDGSYDSQTKVAVDYGCILYCMSNVYDTATHHDILVRLYRPGYHTLEIESWTKDDRLAWTKADRFEEQELAIDSLVSTWKTTPQRLQNKAAHDGFVPPRDPIVFHYLAPGSTSDAHRRTLLFAASEYDRLMPKATDEDSKARLKAKAASLREMAGK